MAPPSKGVAPLRKARTIINDGTMPGAAASDRPAVSAAGVDGVLRLSNGLSDGPWQPLNHSIYSLFVYMVAVKATILHMNRKATILHMNRGLTQRSEVRCVLGFSRFYLMTLRRSPMVRGSVCTTYSRAASLHPQHNIQEANIGRQD